MSRTFILSVVFCFHFLSATGQNHGSPCGSELPLCDPLKHLECDEVFTGRCVCSKQGYFDSFFDECRLRSGTDCTVSGQRCVQNAVCDNGEDGQEESGTCTCNAMFEPNSQRRCFWPHQGTCSHGVDLCDPDGFMQCGPENKCECRDQGETTYVPRLKTCQLRSGARCGTQGDIPGQLCATYSSCDQVTNRCQCFPQFYANRDGLCFLPLGSPCNSLEECDQSTWQHCDRSCVCSDQPNSVYDRQSGYCRKLVDASCDPAPTVPSPQPCVRNSVCSWDRRRCECEAGLSSDTDRQCYLGYNGTCGSTGSDLCNANKYMECSLLSGRCECKWSVETAYDLRDGICKLKADAACSQLPNSQPCIPDAACGASEGPIPARCQCQFNLEANRDRLCYLRYGRPCDGTLNKCDPAAQLICNGQTNSCDCSEDHWYDPESRTCKVYVDGNCREDGDCLPNANCHLGKCVCNEGFESSHGVACMTGYGGFCGVNENQEVEECSAEANLHCIGGLCLCEAGYTPEPVGSGERRKCVAGYQYPCNATVGCSASGGFACLGGKCDCIAPGEQVYLDGRCGSLVDARCHLNPGNNTGTLHCTTNAECAANDAVPFMGRCQCKPEFVQTLSKTCIPRSVAFKIGGNLFSIVTVAFFIMGLSVQH